MVVLVVRASKPTPHWNAYELNVQVWKWEFRFGIGRIYEKGWTLGRVDVNR